VLGTAFQHRFEAVATPGDDPDGRASRCELRRERCADAGRRPSYQDGRALDAHAGGDGTIPP
jgi:hypothetical protein